MCIRDSIKGVNPETEEQETRPSSDDAPFAALAFKIATDPFVGKLAYFLSLIHIFMTCLVSAVIR